MVRYFLHLASVTIFLIAIIVAAHSPVHSDSLRQRERNPLILDSAYRSPSPRHKVIVQSGDDTLRNSIIAEGGSLIADYGAFALYSATDSTASRVSLQSAGESAVRDDMNVILLRAAPFDTTAGEPFVAASLDQPDQSDNQLYLVQMVGPVKDEWLNELQSNAEIVSYIPNNAYLVRASADGLARINEMKSARSSFIQYTGAYKPAYKIAPELSLASDEALTVTVQLVTSNDTEREIQELASQSSATVIGEPSSALSYTNVRVRVARAELAEIARMSDVVWIEPYVEPQLLDERQGLIISGNHTDNQLARPGYLAWLRSKGLASTPDFLVDIADGGIDQGVLDPQVLHRDFLNTAGLARVAYARYVGEVDQPIPPNDIGGHGTINAAIVGGYNTESGFPYTDTDGYSLGLGIHPFIRLGVTKIFAPDYTNPPLATMVDMMYRDGVRISSNSWGAYNNSYNVDSQLYDSMVRDARPNEAGNQEMTIVFSAGNKGAGGHLTIPGNGKNTIMVGASENLRPGDDGCRIDSTGGDDLYSLINFSSGGPTTDGRIKPDIVAPGTHIQGARSQDPNFTGGGVCGGLLGYPRGQTLYTWSSGTSHSAPAVAGAAALVRQYFQQSIGHAPSPAMIKAFLTNSTTYMTGYMANDNLPGNNQGWGLLNIGRALDNVPRMMVDQDRVLGGTGQTFTMTGRVSDPTKPFRVTLAWTDAPGTPASNPVVNNLDLQVEIGGKTYLGNHFNADTSVEGGTADRLNNVESVWLPAGVTGDFTVRVIAANISGDGVPGNSDATDQDFALVAYNARSPQDSGPPAPVDSPPTVTVKYPEGGERLMVGSTIRILWDASDDKGIQSQRVEFSPDGVNYFTIATLDGKARSYDWHIPSVPTTTGRIRVTVLDGVNLPISSVSAANFEVFNGPPDTTPPQLALLSPNTKTIVGGGMTLPIKWKESDNVGVLQRVIELSLDNGDTWQEIVTLVGPGSGEDQTYEWQIPAAVFTDKARVRMTLFDGAGNATVMLNDGKFDIWPMPIITQVTFNGDDSDKPELELKGRNFRIGEAEIYVDGVRLKKIRYAEDSDGNGMCRRISSVDRKLNKRAPLRKEVSIEVRVPRTGQVSPAFTFRRRKGN